jgi:hypothetical protein
MRTPHPAPRPSRPSARALPPGCLPTVLALAALLLASCTDDVAANCPPLAHPEVLSVAAASNPCQAKAGESAALLALRVVRPDASRTAPLREGGR